MTELAALKRTADGYLIVPGIGAQHRLVLRHKLGTAEPVCFWCAKQLAWQTHDQSEMVTADHLNWMPDDNRPDNLVPSCMMCNTLRRRPGYKRANLHAALTTSRKRSAELQARLDESRRTVATLNATIRELNATVRSLAVARSFHPDPPQTAPTRRVAPHGAGLCLSPGCEETPVRLSRCDVHARQYDRERKQRQRQRIRWGVR